ncbi:MAG: diaminopimelate epimerase, partial [Muribaculaceae bacterium]|nr:diaminopimelate epimerase [Muribaculaceae bacterium]
MNFTKMHGCGNDYIYIDCRDGIPDNVPELAMRLSDRHKGIGGDGIILICSSDQADFLMRIFNADGSEGRMCGNGIRCVAKYVFDKGLTDKHHLLIDSLSGIKTIDIAPEAQPGDEET